MKTQQNLETIIKKIEINNKERFPLVLIRNQNKKTIISRFIQFQKTIEEYLRIKILTDTDITETIPKKQKSNIRSMKELKRQILADLIENIDKIIDENKTINSNFQIATYIYSASMTCVGFAQSILSALLRKPKIYWIFFLIVGIFISLFSGTSLMILIVNGIFGNNSDTCCIGCMNCVQHNNLQIIKKMLKEVFSPKKSSLQEEYFLEQHKDFTALSNNLEIIASLLEEINLKSHMQKHKTNTNVDTNIDTDIIINNESSEIYTSDADSEKEEEEDESDLPYIIESDNEDNNEVDYENHNTNNSDTETTPETL